MSRVCRHILCFAFDNYERYVYDCLNHTHFLVQIKRYSQIIPKGRLFPNPRFKLITKGHRLRQRWHVHEGRKIYTIVITLKPQTELRKDWHIVLMMVFGWYAYSAGVSIYCSSNLMSERYPLTLGKTKKMLVCELVYSSV